MTTLESPPVAATFASRIIAVLALLPDFGDDLHGVEVRREHCANPDFRAYADVAISVYADGGRCETLAAEILDAYPAARIDREGSGAFAIVCGGDPSWSIYFSNSTCVRVQTGTHTVTKPDPEAVAALPMITREEPVYEWRCADPLADLARAAS